MKNLLTNASPVLDVVENFFAPAGPGDEGRLGQGHHLPEHLVGVAHERLDDDVLQDGPHLCKANMNIYTYEFIKGYDKRPIIKSS